MHKKIISISLLALLSAGTLSAQAIPEPGQYTIKAKTYQLYAGQSIDLRGLSDSKVYVLDTINHLYDVTITGMDTGSVYLTGNTAKTGVCQFKVAHTPEGDRVVEIVNYKSQGPQCFNEDNGILSIINRGSAK